MIAELSAALSALKETTSLVKIINDAKNDAEIKSATFALQNKLLSLQAECFSLGEAMRSREEEINSLKSRLAEFEDFKKEADGYKLEQLDAGSFVYSKKQVVGGKETTVYLCPQCFGKKILSILQPVEIAFADEHLKNKCPSCHNEFWMNLRKFI